MNIRNLLYEKDVKMIVMKCCLLTLVGVTLTDANSCAEDVEEWKDKKYPTDPRRAQQEFAQVHLSAAQMSSMLMTMLVVAKSHLFHFRKRIAGMLYITFVFCLN